MIGTTSQGNTGTRRAAAAAWRLAALLLLSTGAQAAVECAAADATGARLCTAGLRSDLVQVMEATQERGNWCWAAVVSMMLRRHGIAAPQQAIVTRSLGAPLDQRLRTSELPAVFEREWLASGAATGARATAQPRRMHLSDPRIAGALVQALGADQPWIMSARGHSVVLVGVIYQEPAAGGERKVLGGLVIDPLPARGLRYLREDEMAPALLAQVEVAAPPVAPARRAQSPSLRTARGGDTVLRVGT